MRKRFVKSRIVQSILWIFNIANLLYWAGFFTVNRWKELLFLREFYWQHSFLTLLFVLFDVILIIALIFLDYRRKSTYLWIGMLAIALAISYRFLWIFFALSIGSLFCPACRG